MKISYTVGMLVLGAVSNALAIDWDGSDDNDFNNGENWSGGNVPSSTESAEFADDGATIGSVTNVDLSSSITVQSLDFDTAESWRIRAIGSTLDVTDSISSSGSGNALLRGSFQSSSADLSIEVATGSDLRMVNGDLSGSGTLSVNGDGRFLVNSSSTVAGFTTTTVASGTRLQIAKGGSVSGEVVVAAGGQLRISGGVASSSASLGDVSGDGTWVFNANSLSTAGPMATAGVVDISAMTLNVLSSPSGASPGNPVILLEYNSFAGTGTFGSITGLAPGQSIDYNFNGTNQIAIVPEPSNVLPVLLGFLPLLVLRKRFKGIK